MYKNIRVIINKMIWYQIMLVNVFCYIEKKCLIKKKTTLKFCIKYDWSKILLALLTYYKAKKNKVHIS